MGFPIFFSFMRIYLIALVIAVLGTLTACNQQEISDPVSEILAPPTSLDEGAHTDVPLPLITPTVTPLPPRVLTVCMGQEPASLFLYGDTTSAAQGVRQAIYDGPFDVYNYEIQPVILEKLPSLTDGDAFLRPIEVIPGSLIIDAEGNWVVLEEGVNYRPSGCTSSDCVLSYTGDEPVMLDELVAQFRLLPGIRWSDGTVLTVHDSVYSYQVLKALYAGVPSDLLRVTRSYLAIDDLSVEWVSVPGYQNVFETHFFTPLPQHLWGMLSPEELLTSELSTRMPLGWGPYVIEEWVAGDHISLQRNANYFRASEGLPNFDFLVFRFAETPEAALDALLVGECDFLDRSTALDSQINRVMELHNLESLQAFVQSGTAWEQISFGVTPLDPNRDGFFVSAEVRQAVAMCIDRTAIAEALFQEQALIPDTYVPATHPLRNLEIAQSTYDPEKAAEMLQFAGWIDHDADPATPRISTGVPGVLDGTPFIVQYLAPSDAERPAVAQQIAASLAQCGIQAEISLQEWEALLGPGPEGPVFGRQFDLAQFAWAYSIDPTCNLFSSSEIPGPSPEYPKGWTGGNATGYQNPEYDRFCKQTLINLPDSDEYRIAQNQAQAIFSNELPALPLYQRLKLVAMRPDMCNVFIDPAFGSALSTIEAFDYGESCK
jgi:peptide/nickel transport system substrate-binding protein